MVRSCAGFIGSETCLRRVVVVVSIGFAFAVFAPYGPPPHHHHHTTHHDQRHRPRMQPFRTPVRPSNNEHVSSSQGAGMLHLRELQVLR